MLLRGAIPDSRCVLFRAGRTPEGTTHVRVLLHPIVYVKAVYRTFFEDGISIHAAGLSFKTLLSLIPLGVIVATIYAVIEFEEPARDVASTAPATTTPTPPSTAVPSTDPTTTRKPVPTPDGTGSDNAAAGGAEAEMTTDSLGQLRGFLDNLFVPEKARKATLWIEQQVRQLRKSSAPITLISLIFLAATAFFLFRTVETVMNRIFQVRSPRALGAQIVSFWAFLTLGPLLVGASMYATYAISRHLDVASLPSYLGFLAHVRPLAIEAVPFVITLIAFFLLNWLAPNTYVRVIPALGGAAVAAVLWEIMKYSFNFFLQNYVSYEPLYGGMATGVILLLWLHLSWFVALLGATLAFHLQVSPESRVWPGTRSEPRLALGLVALVADAFLQGKRPPTEKEMTRRFNCGGGTLREVAVALEDAGILARTESRRPGWVPARDPARIALSEVYEALGESLGGAPAAPSGAAASTFFRNVEEAVLASLQGRTVQDLLDSGGVPTPSGPVHATPEHLENPEITA